MFGKKIGGKTVGVLLMTAMLLLSAGAVSAATLTVDSTNSTDSANNQYATIQEAVNNSADGDTIELSNTNYTVNETIDVTTNNLSVVSASGDEVTIDASNTNNSKAFNTSAVNSFTIGDNVTVESGSNGLLGGTFDVGGPFSTPVMVLIALMLIGGYWYVRE